MARFCRGEVARQEKTAIAFGESRGRKPTGWDENGIGAAGNDGDIALVSFPFTHMTGALFGGAFFTPSLGFMKPLIVYTLALTLTVLTGCAGVPSTDVVYSLKSGGGPSATVVVIDNRPESEKLPRLKGDSTLYLGDRNFVPARIDVLSERLASKLSHVSPPVVVHVDSFEFILYDDTGRSGALSTGASVPVFPGESSPVVLVPSSLAVGVARSWTDRTVICAISGRANGRLFEVNEYKNVAPGKIARGLEDVLTAAVEEVVEQITGQGPSK